MMNLFLIIFIIASIMLSPKTYAAEISAGSSAVLLKPVSSETADNRPKILKEYLTQYNSPLVPFASDFVEIADRYNLDWRLVAGISGVESTFGNYTPYNSYNAWGWGVYGNNVIYFSSWSEGIKIVSKGFRENYIDKGATNIYDIGRIYAESPTWAARVEYFMAKMSELQTQSLINNLSISF